MLQLIYGNLVPHIEQLHSVLGSRSDYATSDNSKSVTDPPGGLAVCTGAPWFPPLAITAPTRNLPLMALSIPDKSQVRIFHSLPHIIPSKANFPSYISVNN